MSVSFESGFKIIRFSDIEYEKITVEIQYAGEQIAQINQDKGIDSLEVEILVDYIGSKFVPKFPLDALIEVLETAQQLIKEKTD